MLIIVILSIAYFRNWKQLLTDKRTTIFLLLTLGILAQAVIFQVTSYTPPDNNIFYHSFAFAFILSLLSHFLKLDFLKLKPFLIAAICLLFWWSGVFWKYIQRIVERVMPSTETAVQSGENLVNRQTYMIFKDTAEIPMSQWTFTNLKSFEKIYMPKPTVDGLERLMNMNIVKQGKKLNVLNMTELTPLVIEIPYRSETGSQIPLWHHLGVGMFNKEAKVYEKQIQDKNYDLVLFEYVPNLNNFFPFRVRDSLQIHYKKIDSFPAPRRGETKGTIEVYINK